MALNNVFSTGFNSGFGTGFGVGTGGWDNNQNPAQTKTTKQQKFPGLNQQQIANIEKYTANLTGAEKKQEQQKIYQAMIQAIEAENFNDSRTAMENERYRDSLSKTDPRECKFDQSACRQSALVDLVKDARNLKANTDENTVMQMFMQEMDYRGIGMDKLNAYLDSGDESILYETGLKTQRGGTKDLINQAGATGEETRGEKNLREKGETITNYTNVVGLGAEKLDDAASKFADNWLARGTKAAENTTESLKGKVENMSPEEVERYRKQYQKLLKNKDLRVGQVQGDTIVEQLWNGIKGNISYDYNDEDFIKWVISQKANLGESLTGADDILSGEHNPNVVQLFGNIPASALKTFTATIRGKTNPYDSMKGIYKLIATPEGRQAIIQRYGSWDAFADTLNNDPVGAADDALALVELGTNVVGAGMKATGKMTGNTDLVTRGGQLQGSVGSANDVLADQVINGGKITLSKNFIDDWKNTDASLVNGGFKDGYNPDLKTVETKGLYGVMDKTLGDKGAFGTLNRALQDQSNLGKLSENIGKDRDAVKNSELGQMVKNATDEAINKIVGIDEEDRKFIRENKDLVNDTLSKKKNVETIVDEVKSKIDDKRLANTEMGKEYGELRKNKSKVVNTQGITNDLKKSLKEQRITIDADGNLKFSDINKFNAKQKAAIVDAWNELKMVEGKKNINAGDVLDLRQKFDDKLNWDGKAMDLNGNLTASDKATEGLIRDMRGSIDNRAKTSVAGLKELDAKYSEALAEMQQIKKDWLDHDGTLKDSARSKLRNLTKAGNEAKLERLEKLIPGITDDLKALDVALTVERASKQGVGQYAKGNFLGAAGGGAGLGTLFGNPVLGALGGTVLWILSSPKNYVKLVEIYPDIAEKLSAGQELLPSDMNKLQSLASRLQDGMKE